MKRMLSLALCLALLLGAAPALATAIPDYSAFYELEGFAVYYDGRYDYLLVNNSDPDAPYFHAEDYFTAVSLILESYVDAGARKSALELCFGVSNLKGVTEAIILADDVRYHFALEDWTEPGAEYSEGAIGCGNDALAMLSAMVQSSSDVKVRLIAPGGQVDFTMTDGQLGLIEKLLTAYLFSDFADSEFLTIVNNQYPIQIQ